MGLSIQGNDPTLLPPEDLSHILENYIIPHFHQQRCQWVNIQPMQVPEKILHNHAVTLKKC